MLLLGTDPFTGVGEAGAEGEILKNYIENNYIPADYTVTKLYETDGTLTVANVTTEINAGYGLVNFVGHGNIDRLSFGPGGTYYNADASGQTNGSKLPIIFALACATSWFDGQDCIGEAFMLNANGGAIAYFSATRTAYGYVGSDITSGLAGELDWRFSEVFFGGERVAGKLWGRAITDYVTAHPPSTYHSGFGYLDWWTAAEHGSPFMDPTLTIGGDRITIETSNLVSSYPATISYVEAGVPQTDTTYGTWSGKPDYNTHLSISNPVSASATERYHTPDTTSWTVPTWATYSVAYYHQWKPTISVATASTPLDATNYVTLTYTRDGSSGTFNVFDAQSYNDWIDDGSTASLSNPSSGSTSTHRWYSSGTTSWTINDASARSATYYDQFLVTIATTGLSPAHPATITFVQYGTTNNPTTSATWSDWADAGSTLSIENSVEGGWFDWSTGDTTSWTVDSAISATVNYQRSYLMLYIIAGVGGAVVIGAAVVVTIVIRRRRGARI